LKAKYQTGFIAGSTRCDDETILAACFNVSSLKSARQEMDILEKKMKKEGFGL
jgi:hypothetical protein